MKTTHRVAAGCLILALGGVFAVQQSGAFSIRELLGLEKGTDAETGAGELSKDPKTDPSDTGGDSAQNWAAPGPATSAQGLSLSNMQTLLANADASQRQALLSDESAFRRFVQQEADNLSLLAAARTNRLHQDQNTAFLMQRGAENILRESYLNRLIAGKIPSDFPSDEQVKEYFEKNRDQFVVPERLHVWQIFLAVGEQADKAAIDAKSKLAAEIVKELNERKADFATLALKHSAHEPSRHNGGYMGLVKVSDLKPEISKPLLALAEGKISDPIKTDSGIHVLKHGAKVAAEPLAIDTVRQQIRQLLINQARTQLRAAIYEQARKSYPVDIPDKKIEEWWLRLRTDKQESAVSRATKP
ncbi:MAG: peptidylprolyl isomerase [Gammaproteobacteria bacterium]|nr:peptidylprolyl isomerase [Gammaproteobacteria bacterium]